MYSYCNALISPSTTFPSFSPFDSDANATEFYDEETFKNAIDAISEGKLLQSPVMHI
jgi:hypothetical protein